jgi:NIMA (never in mitosis gene a)-related kinase 1/4/5
MWSLGCVFYEMLTLLPPFRAKDMSGLFQKVTAGVYQDPPKLFTPALTQVVTSLIKLNHKERPSCAQLLRRPEIQAKIK